MSTFFERNRRSAIVSAALLPLLVCAVLVPFREDLANTNAALILVLAVVAAAATGIRPAGLVAAASSAVWFDFFLTEPYESLHIDDGSDIETAALLVLVGLAVTEIALWGRRRQAEVSRQDGFLNGIADSAGRAAGGEPLIDTVTAQLVAALGLDDCRYADGPPRADLPVLRRDGSLVRSGRTIDVDRHGLPTDTEIAVPVTSGGVTRGHLLLTASTRVARPTVTQRRIAPLLADQIAVVLTDAG